MSIWNEIYDNINNLEFKLVGLFIGCSMDYYSELTNENNQQYPCFLNNFDCKKIIILIDPCLEINLKIEEYFLKLEHPLQTINKVFINDEIKLRVLKNDNVMIYAINEPFNYINYDWLNKIGSDTEKLYTIINICLRNKTKLILQDYSGNDTSYFYADLLTKYNRQDLLNYINMDITQFEGGCRFNINNDMVKLDKNDNFLQEKFSKLSNIKNSKLFNKIFKFRLDILLYPILYYHNKLCEDPTFEFDKLYINKIKLLFIIYDIEYYENVKDVNYYISKFEEIFKIILKDIIIAKDLELSFYDYCLSIIKNRFLLYETFKMLQYE